MLYVGKESKIEQWHLLHSLPAFSHFPCYPQAKWALLVLTPMWVDLCTFWDPVGLSNELSCEAEFLPLLPQPPRGFQSEVWGFSSPCWSPGVVQSVLLPSCFSWFICVQMWDRWVCQPPPCLESSPPSCASPPCLPVWMNVSSLSPWLSDFHTVWFSVSSGCVLFLNSCPSFGCVRRHSVSTYASTLARSLKSCFFK